MRKPKASARRPNKPEKKKEAGKRNREGKRARATRTRTETPEGLRVPKRGGQQPETRGRHKAPEAKSNEPAKSRNKGSDSEV